MALIPDRRHGGNGDFEAGSTSQKPPPPGSPPRVSSAEDGSSPPTYRELLEQCGLDLTGHPLADRFDGVAEEGDDTETASSSGSDVGGDAVANSSVLQGSDFRDGTGLWSREPSQPPTDVEVNARLAEIEARQAAWLKKKREEQETLEQRRAREEREAREEQEAEQLRAEAERECAELDARFAEHDEEKLRKQEAALVAEAERAERHQAVAQRLAAEAESGISAGADTGNARGATDPHPLLDEYRWSDLQHIAPEVANSVEKLQSLLGELSDFTRPMGPEDAVTMLDGLETLDRVNEALMVVTLSVFERVGTPRDFGAKSTRALVQQRLNVSYQEASRRTQLAERLGKRTAISGESIAPEFPTLSAALHDGTLSSNQASTIAKCLISMPPRISERDRLEAERILVEKAPDVRVRDIHALFEEILGWIDPDGQEPKDAVDREEFNVNLRQLKDGTWTFKGRLDEVTGGVLNGLLTSRIKADDDSDTGDAGDTAQTGGPTMSDGPAMSDDPAKTDGPAQADDPTQTGGPTMSGGPGTGTCGDGAAAEAGTVGSTDESTAGDTVADRDQFIIDTFAEVLRGDRADCLDPSLDFSQPKADENGEIPHGAGVREDGTLVAMAEQQPSVRRRIYERFSSLISGIEMNRIKAGASYALVVTARAEDVAAQAGKAATGVEAPFPITTAALEGLNGSVFFHLMGEKTKSMALATERRLATEKQLAILASRDQGCTFPGCDTPPGWCEAHHIVPWADGGKTDVNNLTLACSAHHHLIDKSDWYCIMLADGRPAWIPPASLDPAREPILHARFIAREIGETLFG